MYVCMYVCMLYCTHWCKSQTIKIDFYNKINQLTELAFSKLFKTGHNNNIGSIVL